MGRDHLDCRQDRVLSGDAAEVGPSHGAGYGAAPGVTTGEQARLKALERENRELRHANEILRKASAFVQAELERRGS